MTTKIRLGFPIGILLLFFSGLAAGQGRDNRLDHPDIHADRGDQLILKKEYQAAYDNFKQALKLDPEYSPAISGMAVAKAHLAVQPGLKTEERNVLVGQAFELLEDSLSEAEGDAQEARANYLAIQVYVTLKLPKYDWIDEAHDHFETAEDLRPKDPGPYFYMARAEAAAFNIKNADSLYAQVIKIGKKFSKAASKERKALNDIRLSIPESKYGRLIAYVDRVTRADVAALLVAELDIEKLYKRNKAKRSNAGFAFPDEKKPNRRAGDKKLENIGVDYAKHQLKSQINEILKLQVKGLELDAQAKFHPAAFVTRAESALLIQDILINVTGNKKLARKYLGQTSPYNDVRKSVAYYNAVRVVKEQELMGLKDVRNKLFEPTGTLSGSEVLLAISKLKKTYMN